nr:hypothetical protein [Desulfatibacillum aliphaticivorans]
MSAKPLAPITWSPCPWVARIILTLHPIILTAAAMRASSAPGSMTTASMVFRQATI